MKLLRIMSVAGIVLLVTGPPCLAGSDGGTYRSGVSGDWNSLATWEISDPSAGWRVPTQEEGVPQARDHATIQAGHTVTVATREEIGKLHIERGTEQYGGGVLEIVGGVILTVHRDLQMPQRPREFEAPLIVFSGTGPEAGVLESRPPLGIGGDVRVTGEAGGHIRTRNPSHLLSIGRFARIQVSGGPLTLGGALSMNGTVAADGPHAVVINGQTIRAGSSGTWHIRHPQARMSIETLEPVSLRTGTIRIDQGELHVAVDMQTLGTVTKADDARITVRPGRSFDAPRSLTAVGVRHSGRDTQPRRNSQ